MKLVFIRHADPDYEHNTLTEKGFLEAEALGKMYSSKDFDEVYSSTLPRAYLTCDAVIKGEKKVNMCDWLVEFGHPVDVDGNKQIPWDFKPDYFIKHDLSSYDYLDFEPLKSGEIKKYYDEVIGELDKVLEKHGYIRDGKNYKVVKESTETIVFFCHFGIMSVLMSHLMNIPFTIIAHYFVCLPSGVTKFISEEREKGIAYFRMNNFSDISHLKKVGLEPSFAGRFCEVYSSPDRH